MYVDLLQDPTCQLNLTGNTGGHNSLFNWLLEKHPALFFAFVFYHPFPFPPPPPYTLVDSWTGLMHSPDANTLSTPSLKLL